MTNKILFVDNDVNTLDGYERRLRKQFQIDTAQSGEEGLDIIASKGPYAVVISDLSIPGMDGFQFLSRVKDIAPDCACIVLTGHANLQVSLKAVNEGYIFRFLTKPCKIHILAKAIFEGIGQHVRSSQLSAPMGNVSDARSVKKIMVVDDDLEILSLLSDAFKSHHGFEVLSAENGEVAVKLLNTIKIDVVIADKEMPKMNGLELLSYISQNHPEIPVIILTWCITPELDEEITNHGAFKYFEKPLDLNAMTETLFNELYSGPQSIIDGISIASCLRMIEMEEKTCTLKINSGNSMGFLYFLKGRLIAAETGKLKSEQAAYRIINWVEGAIEIENKCDKRKNKITQPLMHILMEAARITDDIDLQRKAREKSSLLQ